ncbi:MAG: hypothetical protein JST00_04605 [Deltaproteobacteria bacterium]|nr:hypothetical protein [Deltaproteobacteria bacterium]
MRSISTKAKALAASSLVVLAVTLASACASSTPSGEGEVPGDDAGGGVTLDTGTEDRAVVTPADAREDVASDATTDVAVTCPVCTYPGAPVSAGTIGNAAITEISGLAASRRHANVLYAHNDSGDTPRIFQLGTDGSTKGVLTVQGATAVDWEDIAVGPCGTSSCVFVADIGDNGKSRNDLKIYRFAEPALGDGTVTADAFPVQYPSGPSDAESLVVDGKGALYIITKESFGAVTLLALGVPGAAGTTLTARAAGTMTPPNLGIPAVTGADFFPGPCPRLAVRTYATVLLFEGVAGDGPEELFKKPFRTLSAPTEVQGEAVAFASDGRALFTASEGTNVALNRYACP